jgi:fibronectin type 3 domain-containing protein
MSKRPTRSIRPSLERLEAREVLAGQVLTPSSVLAGQASQAVRAAQVVPALAPPTAPGSFTATALSTSQVRLSWSASTSTTSYRVYQWGGSSWFQVGGDLPANATSFTVSGLQPGTQYFFYVLARGPGGTTPSAVRDATTQSLTPDVPASFTATALSGTQVKLSWSSSPRADGYRVYRWDDTGKWIVAATLGAGTTSWTASGLSAGQTYYFYVEAFNKYGTAKTAFTTITTKPPPPIPGSFTVTAISDTQARLSWSPSAGTDGYRVYQWNGSAWVKLTALGAGATSYTVSGLTPNWTYYFYVESFNVNGSAPTDFQSVTMPPPALTPPTALTAALVGGQVQLSWADSRGEAGYRVYQWNGSAWAVIGAVGANVTSFTVPGLAQVGTWFYYVEAFVGSRTADSGKFTVVIG